MIASDLVRFGVFAALPFVDHEPKVVVGLAALNGLATGFFRPALWAGVPNLVEGDELETATSLLSTIENAAWMLGPVLAGGILAVWSPDVAFAVNSVSFLVSAFWIARLRRSDLQSSSPLSRGHWRDLREGIGVVRRSAPLITVATVWNSAAIGIACINVAEVVLVRKEIGAGNVGLGVVVGAMGLGLVVGSIAAPVVLGRIGIGPLYAGGILLMAVGFGLASTMHRIEAAVPCVALAAVGNGFAIVSNQLLIQRGTTDEYRGRAVALLMSAYYMVLPIGMVLAGWLTDSAGARRTWLVGAAVLLGASGVAFVRTRLTRSTALVAAPAIAGAKDTSETAAPPSRRAPENGVERVGRLLDEVERTRRREAERPPRRTRVFKYARHPARR